MSHVKISVPMATITDSRFESLSNEILLDIFEYLDAYNLCQAFYSLNHRINTLLRSVYLYLLANSTTKNIDILNNLPLCFSPSQIRMLSIGRSDIFIERILSPNNLNLRSIHLRGTKPDHIRIILAHLPDDNGIKSLHVTEGRVVSGAKRRRIAVIELLLADHGHRFQSLVNLSLFPTRQSRIFQNISTIFPQLRRLSIRNCYWDGEFLQFLLTNTPQLRSLQLLGYDGMPDLNKEISIPQLRELDINYPGQIIYIQNILLYFPNLHRFHIRWNDSQWSSVIKSHLFQNLFERYTPHLKQFSMDFDDGIDEDMVSTFFTNEYWLKKNLKATMVINKAQSRYRLVKNISVGQPWSFQYFDHFL